MTTTGDILSDSVLEDVEVLAEAAATVDSAAEAEAAATGAADTRTPFLTVLKGSPTDADVAALVTVFAAAAAAADSVVDNTPQDRWGEPVQMHRTRAPFSPYSFQNRA